MSIQLNEENGGKVLAVHVSGKLAKVDYEHIAREQYRIIQADEDKAFKSLAKLITTPKDRKTAMTIAKDIMSTETPMSNNQREVLSKINNALQS
jgi:hypothetical protein